VTVFHNGVLVQNHTEIQGNTFYDQPPKYTKHPDKMPLVLMYHGDPVRFRNIWIREIKELEPKQAAKSNRGRSPDGGFIACNCHTPPCNESEKRATNRQLCNELARIQVSRNWRRNLCSGFGLRPSMTPRPSGRFRFPGRMWGATVTSSSAASGVALLHPGPPTARP